MPSFVLHGSRRPCASAYDCEPSESGAAATQKEMAVLGVAKVCQALLLSTDSAGHGTSLDTTGACAPHLWVDGYRPRGCQLWRHVLLVPASSEPSEGRMEESVLHWAQALKPDDGRSYRVAAYTVRAARPASTPRDESNRTVVAISRPSQLKGGVVLLLELGLLSPPALADPLLDAAVNRLACKLADGGFGPEHINAEGGVHYASTGERVACEEAVEVLLTLTESISSPTTPKVPARELVGAISSLSQQQDSRLNGLLASEYLFGNGSNSACPERVAPLLLNSTNISSSTRTLLCGSVFNRLAADIATGSTPCGTMSLSHATTASATLLLDSNPIPTPATNHPGGMRRRLSHLALLPASHGFISPPNTAALFAASTPPPSLADGVFTFTSQCPTESSQLCSASNFDCDGKLGAWTADCNRRCSSLLVQRISSSPPPPPSSPPPPPPSPPSKPPPFPPPPPSSPPPSPPPPPARVYKYSGSGGDSQSDPRFPDCDLADWICLSGSNSTDEPYKVVVELQVRGGLEQYPNRVLVQVANEIQSVASVPAAAVEIVVSQSFASKSLLKITISAEDMLRARKIIQTFGDSFATNTTASALFGIRVTHAPKVYVLDGSGNTVIDEEAIKKSGSGLGDEA
ncbi:MAG: hypothetical protein SGPRY_012375, partial [Prymnesium sp.]